MSGDQCQKLATVTSALFLLVNISILCDIMYVCQYKVHDQLTYHILVDDKFTQ